MAALIAKLTHFMFVSQNLPIAITVVETFFTNLKRENSATMGTLQSMMAVQTLAKYCLIGTAQLMFHI